MRRPRPATPHRRSCGYATHWPENVGQEHPSSLHDVLVEASTLLSAHQLPAIDGAFVQTESRNDGLRRAAVCQERHDGCDQLMRLVRSVESCALGGGEGLAASFVSIALLFLAVDHDMSLARSCVGPAASVVAKSLLRVHVRVVLLLALDTNKGGAGPACSSTLCLDHGSLGCYPLSVAPHGSVDEG